MGKSDSLKNGMRSGLTACCHPPGSPRKRKNLHRSKRKKSLLYIATLS